VAALVHNNYIILNFICWCQRYATEPLTGYSPIAFKSLNLTADVFNQACEGNKYY